MSERRYFKALCASLLAEHETWAYGGDSAVGDGFVEMADETIGAFASREMPVGMGELPGRVARFGQLWRAWRAKFRDDELSLPGAELFDALNDVHREALLATADSPKAIESIAELTRQNVPDAQICDIYEWRDADGRLEISKLHEERTKPGTHCGPDYVHPAELRRRQAIQALRDKLDDLAGRSAMKIEAMTAMAPETLEELVAQNLSARQIGRMLYQRPMDVIASCQAAGLPIPPMDYDSPHTARAPQEPPMNESELRSFEAGQGAVVSARPAVVTPSNADRHPAPPADDPAGDAPMTVEQRVISLKLGGSTPTEIVEAMKAFGETITPQKVNGIVARYKKNPELFE